MIYKDALSLIGNTPILQLNNLGYPNVFVKLEGNNPAGSVKDRAVYWMIDKMEKRGELKKGDKLVEATSGNTGIALAMIGTLKGYEVTIIMPDTMSIERRDLVRSYGASLILTEGKKGMVGAIEKANDILKSNQGYKSLKQFENQDNSDAHYKTTGVEILDDIKDLDIFVCGVGTAGTISGVARYIKSQNPNIIIIALEPNKSQVLSNKLPGKHSIQGIGAGFIPKNYDSSLVDEVMTIDDEDAFDMVRLMASKEGILVGISSGANIHGAIEISKKYQGKKIATIAPDNLSKYMSIGLF